MNREQLMDVLEPLSHLKVQTVSSEASLELTPNGTLWLSDDDNTWNLEDNSRKSLLKQIGVTDALLKKLNNVTASQVATELYRRQGEVSALTADDYIVGFTNYGRYKQLPINEVFDNVEKSLGGDVEYNRAMVLPNKDIRVEIAGQDEQAVGVGDLVRSGVLLQFNPMGLTDPTIQTYGLRLACVNGMTSTKVIEQYALGLDEDVTNEDVMTWMRNTSSDAYSAFPQVVKQWRTLLEEEILSEDRPLLLGGIVQDAGLRGDVASTLWAKATEEPPQTAYDILNLMTWLSSHVIEDPKKVIRLQQVSANFADEVFHNKSCPTCKR